LVDRESAYEILKKRADEAAQQAAAQAEAAAQAKAQAAEAKAQAAGSDTSDVFGAFAKSAARAVGSNLGRQIIRGVLGSIFGGGRRR
jgi:DnaJ-class molecular chaperone